MAQQNDEVRPVRKLFNPLTHVVVSDIQKLWIDTTAQIITFNVGGIIYQTTKETLLSPRAINSLLARIVQGKEKAVLDKDGHFFLDCDGTVFRHVLNYLRKDAIDTLPDDFGDWPALQSVARYCNIGAFVNCASERKNNRK